MIRIIQMNEEKTGKELYKIIKEEILTKDPKIEKSLWVLLQTAQGP